MVDGMSVEEVGEWLGSRGFDEEVREAFAEHCMDGEAIMAVFSMSTGIDSLKDILPKFGQRIKVFKSLKDAINQTMVQEDDTLTISDDLETDQDDNNGLTVPFESNVPSTSRKRSSSHVSQSLLSKPSTCQQSPLSSCSSNDSIIEDVIKPQCSKIPDPFPIPEFRDVTQSHLEKRTFDSSDRTYIVRVLATVLLTYVKRPSMKDCEKVAKSLLLKYAFLKEHYSWQQYLYVRCQNVNRKPAEKASLPRPKRSKVESHPENHNYPSLSGELEDETAHKRNATLIKEQMGKTKINNDSIRVLMKRTFNRRRRMILEDQKSVHDIVEDYPMLKKTIFVAYEMELILHKESDMSCSLLQQQFQTQWELYVRGIINYANSHATKSKDLQKALRDLEGSEPADAEDIVTNEQGLSCLKILGCFLCTKNRKKEVDLQEGVPFILREAVRGMPPSDVIDTSNNFPHIIRIVDETQEMCDRYFIAVEQALLLECRDLVSALFHLVTVHYVFNIKYNPRAENLLYFLQEKIMSLDESSGRRNPKYSSFLAAVDCFVK